MEAGGGHRAAESHRQRQKKNPKNPKMNKQIGKPEAGLCLHVCLSVSCQIKRLAPALNHDSLSERQPTLMKWPADAHTL